MTVGAGYQSGKQSESGESAPWAQQQPYLMQGFQAASNMLNSGGPQRYQGPRVAQFSSQTQEGMLGAADKARSSYLPEAAAGEAARTAGGGYLKGAPEWASELRDMTAGTVNPTAGMMNPYADAYAGVSRNTRSSAANPEAYTRNESADAFNPYADTRNESATAFNPFTFTRNPYLAQGENPYIGDVTKAIGRSVIPAVSGNYAVAGRTGSSPIAQQAMAKGIADALAPYQFGSAEAEMGRRFTGGENEASRIYGSGADLVSRMFSSGENAAASRRSAGENLAAREYGAGESAAARRYGAGENLAAREFGAGENEAAREQAAREALSGRRFDAGSDLVSRLFSGNESALGRQAAANENALTRGMSAYENERGRQLESTRMAPSLEAARYLAPEALMGVGEKNDVKMQQNLDDHVGAWYEDQNAPVNNLQKYMDLIQGNYGSVFSSLGKNSGSKVGLSTGK